MRERRLPLLEDDLAAPGVIEPGVVITPRDVPSCAVVCFFQEVLEVIFGRGEAREVVRLGFRTFVAVGGAGALVPDLVLVGRSWTTDAVYRETRARVSRRVAEGCVTVEMEAAAFLAVARYRNVRFAQLLYAGDSLAGSEWDSRGWAEARDVRERLFWHAADACVRLDAAGRDDD